MKKTLKSIALVLALIMSLSVLASCANYDDIDLSGKYSNPDSDTSYEFSGEYVYKAVGYTVTDYRYEIKDGKLILDNFHRAEQDGKEYIYVHDFVQKKDSIILDGVEYFKQIVETTAETEEIETLPEINWEDLQ